ncbi:hypothetical protein RJ639_017904, partial [Escallonia herrerae]
MKGIREASLLVVLVVLGMAVGQSTATFKDCYAKCFIFCMIEPDHTLCSCTTSCLKECIFPAATPQTSIHEESLGFCKLGCASSLCSKLSTKQNPKALVVMDVTNMKQFVIVAMVVLMLARHATSKFEQCFPPCYYGCILERKGNNLALPDPKKLLPCAWKCIKQCAVDKPPLDLTATTQYYCNLGCMLDFCADVTNGIPCLWVVLVVLGMAVGQSTATFKDCCAICFIFCMIEPDHTLCSCTTSCLKECIFPAATPQASFQLLPLKPVLTKRISASASLVVPPLCVPKSARTRTQ